MKFRTKAQSKYFPQTRSKKIKNQSYRFTKDTQSNHIIWAILERAEQDGRTIYLVWWQTSPMPSSITVAKQLGFTTWEWALNLSCKELLEKFDPNQTHSSNALLQRQHMSKKTNAGRSCSQYSVQTLAEQEFKSYIKLWNGGFASVVFYARVTSVYKDFKKRGWVRDTGGLTSSLFDFKFIQSIYSKWILSQHLMQASFFPKIVAKNLSLKSEQIDLEFCDCLDPYFAPITCSTVIPILFNYLKNSNFPLLFIYSGQTGIMPGTKIQHALLVIITTTVGKRNMFVYDPFVPGINNGTPPKDLLKMRAKLCPKGKIFQAYGSQVTGTDCLIRVLYLVALILAGFDFNRFINFVVNRKHG